MVDGFHGTVRENLRIEVGRRLGVLVEPQANRVLGNCHRFFLPFHFEFAFFALPDRRTVRGNINNIINAERPEAPNSYRAGQIISPPLSRRSEFFTIPET
jgi:hypothetical protein